MYRKKVKKRSLKGANAMKNLSTPKRYLSQILAYSLASICMVSPIIASNSFAKSAYSSGSSCSFKVGEGEYPEASERLLHDDELLQDSYTLDYMRNEIYARHGYRFKNKEWANTFGEKDWYVPCYDNVQSRLSTIEQKNITRIMKMTNYVRKNPQRFSR